MATEYLIVIRINFEKNKKNKKQTLIFLLQPQEFPLVGGKWNQ